MGWKFVRFSCFFESDVSRWDSTTIFTTIDQDYISLDGYIDTQDHYYTMSEQYRTACLYNFAMGTILGKGFFSTGTSAYRIYSTSAEGWDSTTSFATIRARQVEIKAITLDGYIDTQDHYYTTSEQYRTINVMRDSRACLCKVKFPIYTKRTSECWRKGRRGPLVQPKVS